MQFEHALSVFIILCVYSILYVIIVFVVNFSCKWLRLSTYNKLLIYLSIYLSNGSTASCTSDVSDSAAADDANHDNYCTSLIKGMVL